MKSAILTELEKAVEREIDFKGFEILNLLDTVFKFHEIVNEIDTEQL